MVLFLFFVFFLNLAVRQLAVMPSPDETDKPPVWSHDYRTCYCMQGDSPHVTTVGVVNIYNKSFQSRQCVSTLRTILTPNGSYMHVRLHWMVCTVEANCVFGGGQTEFL